MKALVIYFGKKPTFVDWDIQILSEKFEVDDISINKITDFYSLFKKIKNSDLVYIWFAGKHAGISVMLAKFLRKKSILILGGYDVANFPEINYGLWANGGFLDKQLAKYAIKKSTRVITVSNYAYSNLNSILKIERPVYIIPLGIPDDFCATGSPSQKTNTAVTVGFINDSKRIKIKGLDKFIHAAKKMEDREFIAVGIGQKIAEELKEKIPSNLKLEPPHDSKELKSYYIQGKVYCQLSYVESFGMAVIEAMSCGCVPVVSNRGALPEVVGNAGVVVDYENPDSIVDGIKKAFTLAENREFTERVVERAAQFTLHKRAEALFEFLKEV